MSVGTLFQFVSCAVEFDNPQVMQGHANVTRTFLRL